MQVTELPPEVVRHALEDGALVGGARRLIVELQRVWRRSSTRSYAADLANALRALAPVDQLRLVAMAVLTALMTSGTLSGFATLRSLSVWSITWVALALVGLACAIRR